MTKSVMQKLFSFYNVLKSSICIKILIFGAHVLFVNLQLLHKNVGVLLISVLLLA